MQKRFSALLALVVASVATAPAMAAAPDFTTLTGAIDFSTVGTAILAIAALLVAPIVVRKGAAWVLSMLKRG